MPFDQPSSSSGEPVHPICHVDAISDAVLTQIMGGGVHAAALKRPARAADPSRAAFVIWLVGEGRFCLTVPTGRWQLREDAWHLDCGDGFRPTTSPLAAVWDESMLTSRDIHRALDKRVTVAPAVLFLDTPPSVDIAQVAGRSAVTVLWDLKGLAGQLAAAADPQLNPPTADEALAEMCALRNAGPLA